MPIMPALLCACEWQTLWLPVCLESMCIIASVCHATHSVGLSYPSLLLPAPSLSSSPFPLPLLPPSPPLLGPKVKTIAQLQELDRFSEPPITGPLCDLLWSDPLLEDVLGYKLSDEDFADVRSSFKLY